MPSRVILDAREPIVCPKCSERFPLDQGITRQTMERYESEFTREFEKRDAALRETIRKDEQERAHRAFTDRENALKQQVAAQAEERKQLEVRAREAIASARSKAAQEFETEKQALAQELARKDSTLKEFRAKELELRREKQLLEEEKQNLELDVQRRLEQERRTIQDQAARLEAEKFRLKEAEYRKQLEDALRVKDELTRKLEQGSQQLQGEVLELELEAVLRAAFPHDRINPVRKGVRGADVLQCVQTPTGTPCGTIIWEAKRAENWSAKWIQKLKDDRMEAKAELAVIVSTCMPDDSNEPFTLLEDVWVVREHVVKPLAQTLRVILLEAQKHRLINTGRNEKIEALYNYVASPQFAQRIRGVVESFTCMKDDLEHEKVAMNKLWKKREMQIERVALNTSGMVGELEGIMHDALPQLGTIEPLSLPEPDST